EAVSPRSGRPAGCARAGAPASSTAGTSRAATRRRTRYGTGACRGMGQMIAAARSRVRAQAQTTTGALAGARRFMPAARSAPAAERGRQVLVVRAFGGTEPGHRRIAERHVVLVHGLELRVAVGE